MYVMSLITLRHIAPRPPIRATSSPWRALLEGLAYVRHPEGEILTPDLIRAGEYQVNVGGRLYPAAVSLRPPFDPAGDRIRGRYLSRPARVSVPAPPTPLRSTRHAAARPRPPRGAPAVTGACEERTGTSNAESSPATATQNGRLGWMF